MPPDDGQRRSNDDRHTCTLLRAGRKGRKAAGSVMFRCTRLVCTKSPGEVAQGTDFRLDVSSPLRLAPNPLPAKTRNPGSRAVVQDLESFEGRCKFHYQRILGV